MNKTTRVMDTICPVHGNVGALSWVIINSDKTYKLCLVCMTEKLIELGVCEIEFKERGDE